MTDPVPAGAAKVVAGGTLVFAGIVPLMIRRLLGDYWKSKTYLRLTVYALLFVLTCVRTLFPPEEY